MDSDVILSTTDDGYFFNFFDVYNPGFEINGKVRIINIGNWTNETKFIFNTKSFLGRNIYKERFNMNQIRLRISTVVSIEQKEIV